MDPAFIAAYNLDGRQCQSYDHYNNKKNCENNPNCFQKLATIPNKTEEELVRAYLGEHPKVLRDPIEEPFVGLRNLGATCYMNTMLQCLYSLEPIRSAVMNWKPSSDNLDKRQQAVEELQKLFGQMSHSLREWVDTEAFTRCLQLDGGIQQDVHEFYKLIIDFLEKQFKQMPPPNNSLITRLMSGKYTYITKCSHCSRSTKAHTTYTELSFPLPPSSSSSSSSYYPSPPPPLTDCLKKFFSEEEVSDYNCEGCEKDRKEKERMGWGGGWGGGGGGGGGGGKGGVAGRRVELRGAPPPVLHIQLLRFVFDVKTGKEKVSGEVGIPLELDMGEYVGRGEGGGLSFSLFGGGGGGGEKKGKVMYDLHAVICHCGVSANGGHYVVYIKRGEHWWRLDDKKVTKSLVNGGGGGGVYATSPYGGYSGSNSANGSANFRQHDSSMETPYFLVYLQRDFIFSIFPFMVSPAILEENERLKKERKESEERERELREKVGGLKQERDNILQNIALPPLKGGRGAMGGEQEFYWVNTEWLREWMEWGGEGGGLREVDNRGLICEHGKVGLGLGGMKRVTGLAWDYFSRNGGGPPLTHKDLCPECAQAKTKNDQVAEELKKFQRNVDRYFTTHGYANTGYYVAKKWYNVFKNLVVGGELGNPREGLLCEHGEFTTDKAAYYVLPKESWELIHQKFPNMDEPFSVKTSPCDDCRRIEKELRDELERERGNNRRERMECRDSMRGPREWKREGEYCVVSLKWMDQWRKYIEGKTLSKPSLIDLSFLLCPHHKISLSPDPSHPFYQKKGGGGLEMEINCIPSQDFDILQGRYGGEYRVVVQIERGRAGWGGGGGGDVYKVQPEVCEECFKEVVERKEEERRRFVKKEVYFVKIREGSGGMSLRGGRGGGGLGREKVTVECSFDWNLGRIKNILFDSFEISPLEQMLWYNDSLLPTDNDTTLFECKIFPGSTIEVGRDENAVLSFSSLASGPSSSCDPYYSGVKEEGFSGTFLQGSPVVRRDKEGKKEGEERGKEGLGDSDDVVMEDVGGGAGKEEERWGGKEWVCGCGGGNREGVEECRRCGRSREREGGAKEWTCKICTLVNPEKEKKCEVCGADR